MKRILSYYILMGLAYVGMAGCEFNSGMMRTNILPVDTERRQILEPGVLSRTYRLFTSINYLDSIDVTRMRALESLIARETKKHGYCPDGYEIKKETLLYTEGGGVTIVVNCK